MCNAVFISSETQSATTIKAYNAQHKDSKN